MNRKPLEHAYEAMAEATVAGGSGKSPVASLWAPTCPTTSLGGVWEPRRITRSLPSWKLTG